MKLENKIMLIAYADSMGKNLKELHQALNTYYKDAVGGVHILPFFPSSADRGFAPMRYDVVDESFGTYEEIEAIGEEYYLMFDFMVNHISASSEYFRDFVKEKMHLLIGIFLSGMKISGQMELRQKNSWIRFIKENRERHIWRWNFRMGQERRYGVRSAKNRLIWM